MIKTVIEKGMRIGRATLFLPGVISRRMHRGHPGPVPTASRGMPIRRDLRRSIRLPDTRRLILLSVLSVLASLAVTASASAATSFTNPTPIKVPASGDFGAAAPYPSEIAVGGLTGPITNVTVTLHRVGHTIPDELDILLVSPSGEDVMLMSDACGATENGIEDFTWTFSQAAPRQMSNDSSDCEEFTYRPTNYVGGDGPNDSMTAPAPPGPYGISFASFNNENPNGTWKLFVRDDAPDDDGDIEGGWSIAIETGPVDMLIPGSGTSGPAIPYPASRTVSGHTGLISDLDVIIDGIFHERPDDLDLLLFGPNSQKVILMSDACGSFGVSAFGWEWDDEAAAPMPDGDATNVCGTRSHRPTNHGSGDFWPAPAPSGPYATSLSAFDLTDPNGEWRLFVNDDAAGATGFFTNRFQLRISTVPRPDTTAPRVESVAPTGKKVSPKANATATFSEDMNESSVEAPGTFTLKKKGSAKALSASVTYDPATDKAILNPARKLRSGATYTARVSTTATDSAGNALDQNPTTAGNQPKSWRFKVR
jgi:subtilisin-like proprotein convertase family protein